MTIGLVGLGKMGAGMTRRWLTAGHAVVAFDVNQAARQAAAADGARVVESLSELVNTVSAPRLVWLMIPAPHVKATIKELTQLLDAGDTLIDGGNSYYKDSVAHAALLEKRGIHFIDVGVSGGIVGEQTGYALMIGGAAGVVKDLQDILVPLAAPDAHVHVGPSGAGHYVKMVHNAIEYGMMQAIGEGFDLLKSGPFNDVRVAQIARLWSHGTIVRSFLMELAASALAHEEDLSSIAPYVDESGEGRWSVQTAVEHAVPFWVNTAALYARFDSRQTDSFSAKLIAALRKEFGGHSVKKRKA